MVVAHYRAMPLILVGKLRTTWLISGFLKVLRAWHAGVDKFMRRITAFSIAVLLALPAPALANNDASSETQRNPITWLLEDLGNLLKSAANGIQTPAAEPEHPKSTSQIQDDQPAQKVAPVNAESIEFKNPLKAIFNDLAKLFRLGTISAAEEAPVTEIVPPALSHHAAKVEKNEAIAVSETTTSPTKRNPIEWLFSDLAKLLTPTLEIDDRPTPQKTVAITEVTPVSVSEPAIEETQDVVTSPAAQETVPAPLQRNPISWLLSDLAAVFAPNTMTAGSIPVEQPTLDVAVVTAQPNNAVEPKVTEVVTTIEAPSTKAVVLEPAPWTQTPRENIFDPTDNIFDTTSAPLMQVESTTPKTEVAVVASNVEPTLRQRPPYRPKARNHRTLGSNHKSVKPDSVDQGIVANVLEQLFGIDVPAESAEPIANKISDRIVAEEKLDLGYTSPDAPDQANELTNFGDGPLLDQDLYLGRGKLIGKPYKRASHKNTACIERALHGSVFCLEDLDWPARDAKNFDADTAFMMPGEAIIRYENGFSSRVYAVFDASQFADVIKIMQRRFGPPQEREIGWMHILEAPKLPNTTFRWKAVTPDRSDTIILEVRNYDDIRRSFADMDHGMVRLFRTGSRPIFKHISTMDLMLMQRRNAAQASSDVKSSQK